MKPGHELLICCPTRSPSCSGLRSTMSWYCLARIWKGVVGCRFSRARHARLVERRRSRFPHHGSANADVPEVWAQMLDTNPFAVLTPWRKGGRALPSPGDVERILSNTVHAYASARGASITKAPGRRVREVDRTIREAGIKLQRPVMSPGLVRMRRYIGSRAQWQVDLFGDGVSPQEFLKADPDHLPDYER